MDEKQIRSICPRASKSFVSLNRGTPCPNAKQSVRNGPLAKVAPQENNPQKRLVRITSYRVRLADVEGLCGKWHLDALRYAGVIEDDTEEAISYQISQKKVAHKNQEKTLIEII